MIFLQTHWALDVILIGIIGLMIGSFLNVVIIRYPKMLMRGWRADCRELLSLPNEAPDPRFNLAIPRSQCPDCQQRLAFWHNIPLISYLLLRGRCGFCRQPLSLQYPIVELITALASIVIFFHFGWQTKTITAAIMTWGLIALSAIDWRVHLLPDTITLSLLWIGLMININGLFTPLPDAVLGAFIGYTFLWLASWIFKLIRKKQGMGNGDFKMLALFGAWLGVSATLHILLLGVLLSLIVNLFLLLFKKINYHQPLPFGPWLAIAGWVILLS